MDSAFSRALYAEMLRAEIEMSDSIMRQIFGSGAPIRFWTPGYRFVVWPFAERIRLRAVHFRSQWRRFRQRLSDAFEVLRYGMPEVDSW